jgi:hypothetical protein
MTRGAVQQTITTIAESIDIAKTRVLRCGHRITVFGGDISNADGHPLSQRGSFLALVSLNHGRYNESIVTPEEYAEWNQFGVYDDLLTFEEDLCALVDIIVIFLEQPGAIAEFAAFLKNEITASKLIVAVQDEYWEEPSFIMYGLVRHLRVKNANSAFSMPARLNREDVRHLVDEISARISALPKKEALDLDNPRHILLLIADFVELIQIARVSDINAFLTRLTIPLSARRLHQLIFVLERLELVKTQQAGNDTFVTFVRTGEHYVEYGHKGESAPRARLKTLLFEKTREDRRRSYAYKRLRPLPEVVDVD